jgi:hypothetical protein
MRSVLLPLECYFLMVNCVAMDAPNSRDRAMGFQPELTASCR